MRLLIDANLSPSLKQHLLDRFPESVHVFDLGIENDDDLIRKRNCSTAALVQIMENLDVESFMKSDKFKCLIVT